MIWLLHLHFHGFSQFYKFLQFTGYLQKHGDIRKHSKLATSRTHRGADDKAFRYVYQEEDGAATTGVSAIIHRLFQLVQQRKQLTSYVEPSQVASEALGSFRTVASFFAEEKIVQLYKREREGPVRDGIKQGLLCGAGFSFSTFCLHSVNAASFYAGAQLIEAGKVTFAKVFRVFCGFSLRATAISQSGGLAPDSTKAKTGAFSIFALLDRVYKADTSDNSEMILDNVKENIEFQHVNEQEGLSTVWRLERRRVLLQWKKCYDNQKDFLLAGKNDRHKFHLLKWEVSARDLVSAM